MARRIEDWEHFQMKSWKTISCLVCKSTFILPNLSEKILKKKGLYKIIIYNSNHTSELEGWICSKCYKRLKKNMKY